MKKKEKRKKRKKFGWKEGRERVRRVHLIKVNSRDSDKI